MHNPNAKRFIFVWILLFFAVRLIAQPYIDPINTNDQFFNTTYKDSLHLKSKTTDLNVGLFLPKKFKNGNTFLFRLAFEDLQSKREATYSDMYAMSMPIGFQFVTKNQRWKTLVMGIPKISSDLRDNLSKDVQYGGTVLFTYVSKDTLLKLKAGLFYNREAFGNFFVPLIGVDWKVNKRLSIYGILPNNMRVEVKASKKVFFGVGFKNYKRSYRLCSDLNNDFVTVKETQAKVFLDFFIWKNLVVFADAAYMIKYDFGQFAENDLKMKTPLLYNSVYTPINSNFLFTVGLAYRLRLD